MQSPDLNPLAEALGAHSLVEGLVIVAVGVLLAVLSLSLAIYRKQRLKPLTYFDRLKPLTQLELEQPLHNVITADSPKPLTQLSQLEQPLHKIIEADAGDTTHAAAQLPQLPEQDLLRKLGDGPMELRVAVAQFLQPSVVAAWSSVNRSLLRDVWQARGVWLALSAKEGFSICKSELVPSEAFRRQAFRVDCARLSELAAACCAQPPMAPPETSIMFFTEASHVLWGLTLRDGNVQLLFERMVMVIGTTPVQFHYPGGMGVRQAAEAFLSRARRRPDLLAAENVKLLQDLIELTLGAFSLQ